MELGTGLIILIACVVVSGTLVLYYGYRLSVRRKGAVRAKKVGYEEGRRIARSLLKKRYQGKRGFVKPYVEEFNFEYSGETLRKALQETNPTPNVHYLQRVLNDLAPNHYVIEVAPQNDQQEVA